MDKFAFWTLKVLSYIFIASAAASLILWIAEDDSYSHPATSWIVWVSAILTSLFFAATSHVLARVIERLYETGSEEEGISSDTDDSNVESHPSSANYNLRHGGHI